VHLEGTIRARTLLTIARRNRLPLPADTVEGLAQLYEFRDFGHLKKVFRKLGIVSRRQLRDRVIGEHN
jgi:aminodeoxyfutalosine deaminase